MRHPVIGITLLIAALAAGCGSGTDYNGMAVKAMASHGWQDVTCQNVVNIASGQDGEKCTGSKGSPGGMYALYQVGTMLFINKGGSLYRVGG